MLSFFSSLLGFLFCGRSFEAVGHGAAEAVWDSCWVCCWDLADSAAAAVGMVVAGSEVLAVGAAAVGLVGLAVEAPVVAGQAGGGRAVVVK